MPVSARVLYCPFVSLHFSFVHSLDLSFKWIKCMTQKMSFSGVSIPPSPHQMINSLKRTMMSPVLSDIAIEWLFPETKEVLLSPVGSSFLFPGDRLIGYSVVCDTTRLHPNPNSVSTCTTLDLWNMNIRMDVDMNMNVTTIRTMMVETVMVVNVEMEVVLVELNLVMVNVDMEVEIIIIIIIGSVCLCV